MEILGEINVDITRYSFIDNGGKYREGMASSISELHFGHYNRPPVLN